MFLVPKTFGAWTNEGPCTTTCGKGKQHQIRTCTNGHTDKCTATEKLKRVVSCYEAGSQKHCPKSDIFTIYLRLLYKFYLAYIYNIDQLSVSIFKINLYSITFYFKVKF